MAINKASDIVKQKLEEIIISPSVNSFENTSQAVNIINTSNNIKFKEEYQSRIIDCMTGEVSDNYITTPLTDENIIKLEHSKEGVINLPAIKGKTILVNRYNKETNIIREGCKYVSVGEKEDNKLIISSNNSLIDNTENKFVTVNIDTGVEGVSKLSIMSGYNLVATDNENIKLHDSSFNILSGNSNFQYVTRRFYDKNYNYLGAKETEDAFFVRYRNLTKDNFAIEGKATDYIFKSTRMPNKIYQQHKAEVLLKEPLRSLPNGVCDEIIDNKIIRRVGVRLRETAPVVGHAITDKVIIK